MDVRLCHMPDFPECPLLLSQVTRTIERAAPKGEIGPNHSFLVGLCHFCFRRSASRRSRCALMRLISSSITAISSSRRALFDLEASLLRIFSNTFPTGSLVVLVITDPRGRKEALSSDYVSTALNLPTRSSVRMIAQDSGLGQAPRLRPSETTGSIGIAPRLYVVSLTPF